MATWSDVRRLSMTGSISECSVVFVVESKSVVNLFWLFIMTVSTYPVSKESFKRFFIQTPPDRYFATFLFVFDCIRWRTLLNGRYSPMQCRVCSACIILCQSILWSLTGIGLHFPVFHWSVHETEPMSRHRHCLLATLLYAAKCKPSNRTSVAIIVRIMRHRPRVRKFTFAAACIYRLQRSI